MLLLHHVFLLANFSYAVFEKINRWFLMLMDSTVFLQAQNYHSMYCIKKFYNAKMKFNHRYKCPYYDDIFLLLDKKNNGTLIYCILASNTWFFVSINRFLLLPLYVKDSIVLFFRKQIFADNVLRIILRYFNSSIMLFAWKVNL